MEYCPVVSSDRPALVYSGEEAVWFRIAGTLLPRSIADYKIPSCGEILCSTYRTPSLKNLLVTRSSRLPNHEQFSSTLPEFCREHVRTTDAVKTMANKRCIGQVGLRSRCVCASSAAKHVA